MTHRLGRLSLVLLLVGAIAPAAAHAQFAPVPLLPAPVQTVPGELVVGFDDAAGAVVRERARDAVDGDLQRRLGAPDVQLLDVPRGTDVEDAAAALERRPGVAFAEPNYVGHVARAPNDPSYDAQGGTHLNAIDAARAWDAETGAASTKVAVIDTGVDLDHPDLAGNLLPGGDDDVQGHGTHVAGIMAAVGDNATGGTGVAWRAGLVSLRACGASGACTTAAVAEDVNTARANGVKVANLSIEDLPQSDVLTTAIDDARTSMLIVAAAGNSTTKNPDGTFKDGRDLDATTPSFPCSDPSPNVVCVAATNGSSAWYRFSNYGTTSVDLAAPGNAILSTLMDGGYGMKSGTSMAAPQVAGAAALVLSRYPSASVADIRAALLETTKPVAALDGRTAHGLLNVFQAVAYLDTTSPETNVAPATRTTEDTSVLVDMQSNEPNSTFRCSLDSATAAACSPSKVFTLTPGIHTIDVVAGDPKGNQDPSPARQTVTVVPRTTFTQQPPASTPEHTATFQWTTTDPTAVVACRLDAGPWTPDCGTGRTLSAVPSGPHTFQVRATAADGRQELTAKPVTWTVDDAAPTVTVTDQPATGSRSTTIGFTSADDRGTPTSTCAVDGAAPAPCTSPFAVNGVQDGTHHVVIVAKDAAGNESAPQDVSWTVDAPPDLTVTAPAAFVASTSASVPYSVGPDATALGCKLDGQAVDCPLTGSPLQLSGLDQGARQLVVTATDAGGKTTVRTIGWTVDSIAPAVTFSAPPSGTVRSRSATIGYSVEDATSYTVVCRYDDVVQGACPQPLERQNLGDGPHSVSLTATDAAGNVSAASTASWVVDTTAPIITVQRRPAATTTARDAEIAFSIDDGSATTCSIDDGARAPCTSPLRLTNLADGGHVVDIAAKDAVGNGASPASVGWTVTTPPAAPVAAPPPPTVPTAVPTAASTPAPPPTPAKSASTRSLAAAVTKRLNRLKGPAVARLKPFSERYRSTFAGRLKVVVEVRRGKRWTSVGGGASAYSKARTQSVRITISSNGKRLLRKTPKPKLRVRASFTPSG